MAAYVVRDMRHGGEITECDFGRDIIGGFRNLFNRFTGGRRVDSDSSDEEEIPAPDPTDTELIRVSSVDLQISENTKAHHTNEFDITDALVYDKREFLVVRRGQTFDINVTFNRPYDASKDDLRIVFEFGKNALSRRGTYAKFILSDKDVSNKWSAYIKTKTGNSLKLAIMTPPVIAVGKWSLKIDVVKKTDTSFNVFRYKHADPIYILFNPWCKDDQVYMHEEKHLGEYVLNETGKIYVGSYNNFSGRPWAFGQFSGDVLDCTLWLLANKSKLRGNARGDPILVCRNLSALVNSNNDSGVVEGRWGSEYPGGTSPTAWTGSVAILDEYFKTKRPVKYGQCWVFSGVLTTGIPARSVTNFESAHDTDGSITIDSYVDLNGDLLERYNRDSVWNFHVWNDAWMARPDLPSGYGGWQAIDATPQETSQGIYQFGPMPVLAIKRGEVNLPYDGKFAFAEVNSDKIWWQVNKDDSLEKLHVVKSSVGRNMSTKRALGSAREDVTNQYKFPEGSEEERAAVRTANVYSSNEEAYETKHADVKFDLSSNSGIFLGDEMEVTLTLKNISGAKRTINGSLTLATMYYTGVFHKQIGKCPLKRITLEPESEKKFTLKVGVQDYLSKLMDHCICRISCMCIVEETRQPFAKLEPLRLRKPHLTIEAPKQANVGQKFKVKVEFINPLPVTLRKCELRVEGPGLQRPTIYQQSDVGANENFVASFKMTPVKSGEREISVHFNCDRISSVNTTHVINVTQ